ncbi:putative T6SS immunity periplasmic lipoprotein [Pantoea cypripedii]|uniref:putative T6SS immunity periplasmic lipoprotein n=1 Tax=Pantoea cypripedii TaxID=55209 RepID=UPI001ABFFA3A|nr:putative T6SS immunity periplasmic lipoprotein [Pantoea cypripedii]
MFKNYVIIAATVLLSGCPGPGDRIPPKEPANVAIRDNLVCITAPIQTGEYVSAVQISDGEDNHLLRTLAKKPIDVTNGQCLPTFGYDFKRGHTYTAYYTIEKNDIDSGRYLSVVFSTFNGLQQISPPAGR